MLQGTTNITWEALLRHLSIDQIEDLVARIRACRTLPSTNDHLATEMAFVETTVAKQASATPESLPNRFSPFQIRTPETPPCRDSQHYGNVDTGSMINLAYSGVLTAFP